MLHDHVSAALARERRRSFQATADAARQVRLARPVRRGRPGATARLASLRLAWPAGPSRGADRVRLRDGSRVLIRPVRPTDATLLIDAFTRLSARSVQLRFLAPKARLSAAEVRYLTDVDHYDHEAIAVLSADGQGVGIARYIRSAGDRASAEVAITIVDDWQRRGLGAELMTRLSHRARQAGISRFTALVSADNAGILKLLASLGGKVAGRDGSLLEYEVRLVAEPAHSYGFGELIAAAPR
jgi:GNAT superfamily N-acetyltransferase